MGGRGRYFGTLEYLEQGRAIVPAKIFAAIDDHVARERRDRHEAHTSNGAPLRKTEKVGDDSRKGFRAIADEIHFVDCDHDVRDAKKRSKRRVPSGLRHDTLTRIDQQDRKLRGAGGSYHVARVLLVARRIGDDEFAQGRREVCDVDRDALFALGDEPIGQQREIERLATPP